MFGVAVARDLDVELLFFFFVLAAGDAAGPDAKLLVAHEILLAFGEPIVRFGAIENAEIGSRQTQRSLIDLNATGLERHRLAGRRIGDSRGRLVGNSLANVLILSSHDAGLYRTGRRLIAGDSAQSSVAHFQPWRARQPKARSLSGVAHVT